MGRDVGTLPSADIVRIKGLLVVGARGSSEGGRGGGPQCCDLMGVVFTGTDMLEMESLSEDGFVTSASSLAGAFSGSESIV